jgi:hypothetical protein
VEVEFLYITGTARGFIDSLRVCLRGAETETGLFYTSPVLINAARCNRTNGRVRTFIFAFVFASLQRSAVAFMSTSDFAASVC